MRYFSFEKEQEKKQKKQILRENKIQFQSSRFLGTFAEDQNEKKLNGKQSTFTYIKLTCVGTPISASAGVMLNATDY